MLATLKHWCLYTRTVVYTVVAYRPVQLIPKTAEKPFSCPFQDPQQVLISTPSNVIIKPNKDGFFVSHFTMT